MGTLVEINARWARTGHPYALTEDPDLYRAYCPRCNTSIEEPQTSLQGAMNDALVHKAVCKG